MSDVHLLIIAASIPAYLLALGLLLYRFPEHRGVLVLLWAGAVVGFWQTLMLGQIYIFMLVAGAAAVALYDRPVLAGVLIGLVVAVKINFVVWPLLLLLSGKRKIAASAFGVVALVSFIPLVGSGPEIYGQYVEAIVQVEAVPFPRNNSLAAVVPLPASLVAALVLLPLGFLAVARRPDTLTISSLSLVAIPLASPIAWLGYTVFLIPVLLTRPWGWPERITAALLTVPLPFVVQSGGVWGAAYTWAMVLLLAALWVPLVFRQDLEGLRREGEGHVAPTHPRQVQV